MQVFSDLRTYLYRAQFLSPTPRGDGFYVGQADPVQDINAVSEPNKKMF
jgi:hypothetical protein